MVCVCWVLHNLQMLHKYTYYVVYLNRSCGGQTVTSHGLIVLGSLCHLAGSENIAMADVYPVYQRPGVEDAQYEEMKTALLGRAEEDGSMQYDSVEFDESLDALLEKERAKASTLKTVQQLSKHQWFLQLTVLSHWEMSLLVVWLRWWAWLVCA